MVYPFNFTKKKVCFWFVYSLYFLFFLFLVTRLNSLLLEQSLLSYSFVHLAQVPQWL